MGNTSTAGGEITCGYESGVYMFVHLPTDSAYVGSSTRSIRNRLSWHKALLRKGTHSCRALQELWNRTSPEEWEFVILEQDQENDIRAREDFWMGFPTVLLNTRPGSSGAGYRHSEATLQKMREGRARYLETPGARESLSQRAKQQHAAGRLGRSTWN